MRPPTPLVLSVALCVLAAAACTPAEAPAPPIPFNPNPTDGKGDKDDGDVAVGPDIPTVDTGPEDLVALQPKVTLLGLETPFELHDDLFCGAKMKILVEAKNLGDEVLKLIVSSTLLPGDRIIDGADAVLEGNDVYSFTFDGAPLLLGADEEPTPGTDPSDPDNVKMLRHGKNFKLRVAAMTEGADGVLSLPSDPDLIDEKTCYFDAMPPVLNLTTPNPELPLASFTGTAPVAGSVEDDKRAGWVEVFFQGEQQASEASATEGKKYEFALDVDVRKVVSEPDELVPFEVVGYDACGMKAAWTAEAKIVAWPWIRQHRRVELPGSPIIKDSRIVDWDGDGYQDVIVATNDGVYAVFNGGVEAPAAFETFDRVTSASAEKVAIVDIDGDGDLDLVTVESLGQLGDGIVVYRQVDAGYHAKVETHVLPIAKDADIRALVVADFTTLPDDAEPEVLALDDIVVATSTQEDSLVFFKRQIADPTPEDLDTCTEVTVEPEDEGDEPSTQWECDALFADPVKSGSVAEITHLAVKDINGDQGLPDGLPDLVVAADGLNQVMVFTNRFSQTGILDTAFGQPEVSFVWPEAAMNTNRVQHFCLGDFVQGPVAGNEHVDLVAGTESSGTWRVLQGAGGGYFDNDSPQLPGLEPLNVWNMSGTTNKDVKGLVCGDFDQDGNVDFAILSQTARMLQVHLGNGEGRFNQLPGSPYLNPANEGIGFVVEANANRMKIADFDKDGFPDILVDYGKEGLGILMNLTVDGDFDMEAVRTLVTPLGKHGQSTGGVIKRLAVGDLTGDGKAEVVAVAETKNFPNSPWLFKYHPITRAYRKWDEEDFFKKKNMGPTIFVWSQGTHGQHMPSYPAAYDRFPRDAYPSAPMHGTVGAERIRVVDVLHENEFFLIPDGYADLVITGATKGTPKSNIVAYVNIAPGGDFWDVEELTSMSHSMFRPHNGRESMISTLHDYIMVNPFKTDMPDLVIATNSEINPVCAFTLPAMVRYCPWNQAKTDDGAVFYKFWDCWKPIDDPFEGDQDCYEGLGMEVGGEVLAMEKISTATGMVSDDIDESGHLVLTNKFTDTLSYAAWDGPDPDFPFQGPAEKSIGEDPKDIAMGDLDGDGLVDLVAVVNQNIHVAYGQDSLTPFEAPLAIDQDPGFKQTGGVEAVVMTDLNADGHLDIVFTEKSKSTITVYLSAGQRLDELGQLQPLRAYHGPIRIPVCYQPSDLEVHDFNEDGCETLIVICEGAGAIALVENETCAVQNADE